MRVLQARGDGLAERRGRHDYPTDDHDGEIVGVAKVTNANRDQAGASSFCSTIVSTATQAKLAARSEDLKYEWATENPDDVKVGDHIVCYVRSDTKLKDDVLK